MRTHAVADYFRYRSKPHTSCNTCSLCQDRVQTRRMSPINLNSQPQAPSTDAARPGCDTSLAAVPDVRGVTGTPVLSADLSGSITGCNQAALEVFGQTPQEILGRTLAALVLSETGAGQLQLHQAILAAVLKDGEYRSQRRCQSKSGDFIAELSVTLLRDGRPTPTGMVAVFTLAREKSKPGSAPVEEEQEQEKEQEQLAEEDETARTVSRSIDGGAFILASPLMHKFLRMVDRVAAHTESVLITGETGTGKEMAARALHMASPRASLPMVAVNCSALPDNLLEAELFGHVKGAFTGATNHRIGRFEQAHKSTIFLDEIGEMPIELQTKLLRVLQEREIQRLGSSESIRIDVRVVAASNSDLLERVRQGKFREDLYYRLNVVPLAMPPLRQRRGDIPMLVDHFLAKICRNEGIPVKHMTPETKERLRALPWPGNVRQLENMVEMAVAMSGDREILCPADLGLAPASFKVVPMELPAMPMALAESMDFDTVVGHFERSILQQALTRTGGNKTAAAELLGLKRTTLIMKLRGLQDPQTMLERAG